jgi:putative membrane protein
MSNQTETAVHDSATRLAFDRTRLAYERTLMAWIRTAISLITFGFSIYKFFQVEAVDLRQQQHLVSANTFAALMIIIGLASLLMATMQHHRELQTLRVQDPDVPQSLARVLAALISVLGILALVSVILRQ